MNPNRPIAQQRFEHQAIKGQIDFFADSSATIKLRFTHPMQTGKNQHTQRNFIEKIICKLNNTDIFSANFYSGISTNPPLFFKVDRLKSADTLNIHWHDNQNNTESFALTIRQTP